MGWGLPGTPHRLVGEGKPGTRALFENAARLIRLVQIRVINELSALRGPVCNLIVLRRGGPPPTTLPRVLLWMLL